MPGSRRAQYWHSDSSIACRASTATTRGQPCARLFPSSPASASALPSLQGSAPASWRLRAPAQPARQAFGRADHRRQVRGRAAGPVRSTVRPPDGVGPASVGAVDSARHLAGACGVIEQGERQFRHQGACGVQHLVGVGVRLAAPDPPAPEGSPRTPLPWPCGRTAAPRVPRRPRAGRRCARARAHRSGTARPDREWCGTPPASPGGAPLR